VRFSWKYSVIQTFLFKSLLLLGITLLGTFADAAPFPRETAVVHAVRKIGPAVVNISSEYEVARRTNPFSSFGIDPFFDSFFKDFFEPYQERYTKNNLGSGVVIDGKRGYILTNEHVIARGAKIKVTLKDERVFEAQLVGADPDSDLAVLKIVSKMPLPAVEMGNSDDLMIGETIIAIGNPFGFSHTVTTGVISALNRSLRIDDRVYRDFIQTDASINPGNSGGPLLNINGDLIGINTAIYAKAQGIGFAIPINRARRIIDDLIAYGEVQLPWIGVTVQDLDEQLKHYFKIPFNQGVLISEVDQDSPAHKKGLKPGDVVLTIGGKRVSTTDGFYTHLRGFTADDAIPITIWRNGKKKSFNIRATLFPEELAEELAYKMLGVSVAELSFSKRLRFKISAKHGVLITELRTDSYLQRIGVRPGDVIRQINELAVKDVKDFKKAAIKFRQKKSVVVLVQRGDQQYYITVRI
jgi:serine protease Do